MYYCPMGVYEVLTVILIAVLALAAG